MDAPTILCIEDEQTLLDDLVEELQDANYRVLSAKDGEHGLHILQTDQPDLVLCDMMMPKMNGEQVLKAMRQIPNSLAETPFIFLTAKATRQNIIEGKSMGADDYLTKPVDFEMLLATIAARLDQVDRMNERNEQNMVRLYKALSSEQRLPDTADTNNFLVVLIARGNSGLKQLNDGLAMLGCDIIHHQSLLSLQGASQTSSPPRVVFVQDSIELAADTVAQIRDITGNPALAVHALISASTAANDDIYASFNTRIHHPYNPTEVFRAIIQSA